MGTKTTTEAWEHKELVQAAALFCRIRAIGHRHICLLHVTLNMLTFWKLSHAFDWFVRFAVLLHIYQDRIWLTAGHCSSIALTIHANAVALLGSTARLKLCGPGSSLKPLNLREWNDQCSLMSTHLGHRPYTSQWWMPPSTTHVLY